MSKFDFMGFQDGGLEDCSFVVHAKKYTKEEAIDLCISKYDWRFDSEVGASKDVLRKPAVEDVIKRTVRWFPTAPYYVGDTDDFPNGCYTFCPKGQRGSFPVWVIEFNMLKEIM